MKTDDWNWLIVGLLVAIIAILYAGFAEIFLRLRPRVIYLRDGGKATDPPEVYPVTRDGGEAA